MTTEYAPTIRVSDFKQFRICERNSGNAEATGNLQSTSNDYPEHSEGVWDKLHKTWSLTGDVVFLHEVVAGAADRSYGIQVAKLAGLPKAVVARARDVLDQLEASDRKSARADLVDDLPLFSATIRATQAASAASLKDDPLRTALETIHPDDMSPREALDALYRLKAAAAKDN